MKRKARKHGVEPESKASQDKKRKGGQKDSDRLSDDDSGKESYGILPDRDLKKNLGCG